MASAWMWLGGVGAAKGKKSEDQLGLEPLSFSKIADGSDMRTQCPHVTAVFDF